MAKIIPFPNATESHCPHTRAAWLLAYAVLWNHDRLPITEETYAKRVLKDCLHTGILKHSFIAVCERLLLGGKLVQVDPSGWIDLPAIWFHPEFTEGFAGTLSLYRQVAFKRQTMKSYQEGVNVFACYYWRYLHSPSPELLRQCYRRLRNLREYGLLQVWNNTIMLYQIQK